MSQMVDGPLVDEITIDLVPERLSWPEPGTAGHDSALGGNRHYFDLRHVGWRDVSRMIGEEAPYLVRLRQASDVEDEMGAIVEELEERLVEECEDPLWGLDLGVAVATLALAASGCITFSSCNGGVFGEERHLESYPLIAFHMRSRIAPLIASAARASGAGLAMHGDGSIQVYGADAWTLHEFGKEVFNRRVEIRKANKVGRRPKQTTGGPKLPRDASSSEGAGDGQTDLFD
ncbi:hypothetical protein J2800_000988 [Caulobacter rhizosphaerae]|uniref:Uncharacterized protein n=1 Tax=Caulobacter rhizosphaerae TaxID=2010972 RepID=A0ABU1MVN8_9CAUL|nr:hypothetical protein [Caulobacter rhizosphaerae]MDR6530252.1 hypothetical protein [Caulobacter rhizosphaerae]